MNPNIQQQPESPPSYDPNWSKNPKGQGEGYDYMPMENMNIKGQPGPMPQPTYFQQPGYQQQFLYQQQPSYYVPPTGNVCIGQPVGPPPDNYAALSWLTCLFCCWPLGLVAIVKSMEVNSAWRQGDYIRAESSSTSAKKFAYFSLGCGLVGYVFTLIFLVIFISGIVHFHKY